MGAPRVATDLHKPSATSCADCKDHAAASGSTTSRTALSFDHRSRTAPWTMVGQGSDCPLWCWRQRLPEMSLIWGRGTAQACRPKPWDRLTIRHSPECIFDDLPVLGVHENVHVGFERLRDGARFGYARGELHDIRELSSTNQTRSARRSIQYAPTCCTWHSSSVQSLASFATLLKDSSQSESVPL